MLNIAQEVIKGLILRGGQVALETRKERLSGGQVVEYVSALCDWFVELGMKPGDRVLLLNDGDIYFPVFYLALVQRRAVVVPSTTDGRNQFGAPYLTLRTQPKFVISAEAGGKPFADIIPGCQYSIHPQTVVSDRVSNQLAELNIAAIMFTSGTTGEPKGVLVSHQNLCATLEKNISFQKLSAETVELNTLPLTHSFGLGQLNATLAAAGMGIIAPGLANLGRIFKTAKQKQVTSLPTTPAGLGILIGRYASIFQECFVSLETIMVNSAPLPPDMAQSILDLLPKTRLLVYYGLTEASRSTYADLSASERRYLSSVGKPLGNTTVSILPETSEILIKGDNVSPGYFKSCETELFLHPDGILHTGDKGGLIADGRLVIKGRLSNELNIGGYKVDPLEIEQLAQTLEDIDQACLTAVETSSAVFETVLFLCSETSINLDAARQKITSAVEAYKIPVHILQVDVIPTSLNGKISRIEAHEMAKGLLQ